MLEKVGHDLPGYGLLEDKSSLAVSGSPLASDDDPELFKNGA